MARILSTHATRHAMPRYVTPRHGMPVCTHYQQKRESPSGFIQPPLEDPRALREIAGYTPHKIRAHVLRHSQNSAITLLFLFIIGGKREQEQQIDRNITFTLLFYIIYRQMQAFGI